MVEAGIVNAMVMVEDERRRDAQTRDGKQLFSKKRPILITPNSDFQRQKSFLYQVYRTYPRSEAHCTIPNM